MMRFSHGMKEITVATRKTLLPPKICVKVAKILTIDDGFEGFVFIYSN